MDFQKFKKGDAVDKIRAIFDNNKSTAFVYKPKHSVRHFDSKQSQLDDTNTEQKEQKQIDDENNTIRSTSYKNIIKREKTYYSKIIHKKDMDISPIKVLPYFMELVLTNQVRTKESENEIINNEIKRRGDDAAAAATKFATEIEIHELEDEERLKEFKEEEVDEEDSDSEQEGGGIVTVTPPPPSDKKFDDEKNQEADEFDEHRQFRRDTIDSTTDEDDDEDEIIGDDGAAISIRHESPNKLKTVAAHDFYMKKGIGRREGVWKTEKNVVSDSTHRRFSRTAWRQAMNLLEPEYRLPALILKKHLFVKKEGPTRLGPGTYDLSYNDVQNAKRNATTFGQMRSCTLRFPKEKDVSDTPGPGAYGIPLETLEKANDKSRHPGKVSLLASGPCDVRSGLKTKGGSGIPPGYYDTKSTMTELLNKVVSIRGPYDLYTPHRLIIPYGYYKSSKINPLGPGQYNVRKTFKQEWNFRANKYKGIFSPYQRDRKMTGERIVLVAPLWPVDTASTPGPGQYNTSPIIQNVKQYKYPFCSSANITTTGFGSNYDMAPNKYRNDKPKYCPIGCGHKSSFITKTHRLDPLKISILSERLRGKDIPQEERIAWNTQ